MTAAEFRAWRASLGLSLTGSAEALRVSRSTIMRWQSGEHPIPEVAARACELLAAAGYRDRPRHAGRPRRD